jgi:hypothetical protein
MTAQSRKHRGYATQRLLASWFRRRGHPFATAIGAGESGIDIRYMLGLAPEVKATSKGDLLAALRQATANRGKGLPFVIWRPNGYGPERIGQWVVALTLEDASKLLADAGYGDPYEKWGLHDPNWEDHEV